MKILLTGATGLIGTQLTERLLQEGHSLHILSRRKNEDRQGLRYFTWDPEREQIEPEALDGVQAIINLAGANVGEKRWTEKYKREILESRVKSTRLLVRQLKQKPSSVKVFINASATGIYGSDTGSIVITEESQAGKDFLAEVVKAWENELLVINSIRTVALRLGIVFTNKGGALPKLVTPVKYGAGAPLASGKQYISWVAADDVVEAFLFCLAKENMNGAYNVTAPEALTNEEITQEIARKINRPLLLPNVPAFILKLVLGEFADSVIGGSRVSGRKITEAGFTFRYPDLQSCLNRYL